MTNLGFDSTGTFRKFSIPATTKSLRLESVTENKDSVFGKVRVTCQDVSTELDLKSVSQSKNTILDYSEEEVGFNKMVYNVPALDKSLNGQFGVISFFQDLKDARFKSQCGFDQEILKTFGKIKKGTLKLKNYLRRFELNIGDPVFMPSKRVPLSKNFV